MIAVWSFWTKPFRAHHHSVWHSRRHHLLAWVLSLETARKHYSETCLFTDDHGARLLVDSLGLEFTRVSTELNSLKRHDPDWWTLGKLWTYRLQTRPFVHIDNDVFLWKRLPARMESASVFAQNPEYLESGDSCYKPGLFDLLIEKVTGGWLPTQWQWYSARTGPHRAECCGILGGNRVDFINYYADLAVRLILDPKNQAGWQLLNGKIGHNILVEQYFLAACIDYNNATQDAAFGALDVQYLFQSAADAFRPDSSTRAGFTHLIAGAKKNATLCSQVERKVASYYPQHYERCLRLTSRTA